MADKEKTPKIVLEREYNVPLRKKCGLVPKYKRTNKAVKTLREFLAKHMKSDNIKLGKYINLRLWKHGARVPPHHLSVVAKKDEEGTVFAEMKDAPVDKKAEKKEETKKEDAKAEAKPDAKSDAKAEEKPKTEAAPKTEAKSVEAKPAVAKPAQPKPAPAVKEAPKTEAKPAAAKPAEKKE